MLHSQSSAAQGFFNEICVVSYGAVTALTVLTGNSPVAWATHTCSTFPQARITVGAMLETGLVTMAPP